MRPLLCDTRQQRGKHNNINQYMQRHGIECVSVTLSFGDYQVAGSNIAIDTKQDLQEIAGNLGKDYARFKREVLRANDEGYFLHVLIEANPEYEERILMRQWKNRVCKKCGVCRDPEESKCKRYKYHPVKGSSLAKTMDTMESKYGVRFEFCSRKSTGRRICEILGIRGGEVKKQ